MPREIWTLRTLTTAESRRAYWSFLNHKGKRQAKCIAESKRTAAEVKHKLEAKLTLGEFASQDDTQGPAWNHSMQVTVDIYGHLVPGGYKIAVDRLDDAPICNRAATAAGI